MVTVVKSLDPNSESKCETKAPLSQHMLLLATACSTLTSQSQQSQAIGGVDNKINEESRTTHLHNISLHGRQQKKPCYIFPICFQKEHWCRNPESGAAKIVAKSEIFHHGGRTTTLRSLLGRRLNYDLARQIT